LDKSLSVAAEAGGPNATTGPRERDASRSAIPKWAEVCLNLKRQVATDMCYSHYPHSIVRVIMDAEIQLVVLDVPREIAALAIFTSELSSGTQVGIVVNA